MEEGNLRVLSQACTFTKRGKCGTFGCILYDRHPGLHNFSLTQKRKRSCSALPDTASYKNDDDITAAQQLKHLRQHPSVPVIKGHPLQQVVIRVQQGRSIIMSTDTITSLRIQRKWSRQETGGRAGWYKGTITHISEDDTEVLVVYDDGDEHWERIEEVQFL